MVNCRHEWEDLKLNKIISTDSENNVRSSSYNRLLTINGGVNGFWALMMIDFSQTL